MMTDEGKKILIAGDFCPAWSSISYPNKTVDPKCVFGEFSSVIKNADLSIVNLECPLTTSDAAIPKCGPSLKAGAVWASCLKNAGFDLATLSNNHVMDYGEKGLNDTLLECQKAGLGTVGVGHCLKESRKTYYLETDGVKLGVVNFSENEFASASWDKPGTHPMDIVENCHAIRDAKEEADKVIVIIHGGHEHWSYPSPRMGSNNTVFMQTTVRML